MAGLTPPRPLAAEDDRDAFDCGRESLNQWFRRHAWRNQQGGLSRTSVACDSATGTVAGYVALSAAQIERAHLPRSAQRNRPDPIPMILLGQLATDCAWGGRGIGMGLFNHALARSVNGAALIGGRALIVNAIDDEAAGFWRRRGFLPSKDDALVLFRSIADIAASLRVASDNAGG